MERITSRQNPLITRLRRLGAEKSPPGPGVFLCEGVKLVGRPCAGGRRRSCWWWRREPPPAELPAGVRVVEVPEALLRVVSTVETPRACWPCAGRRIPPRRRRCRRAACWCWTGCRTPATWAPSGAPPTPSGRRGCSCCPAAPSPLPPRRCAPPWGPASACRCGRGRLDELTGRLARSAVPLYATALRDDTEDIRAVPLEGAAVVIGSEGRGCPSRCWTPAGRLLKIPMRDRCESLNAAVAASVVLWEGWR